MSTYCKSMVSTGSRHRSGMVRYTTIPRRRRSLMTAYLCYPRLKMKPSSNNVRALKTNCLPYCTPFHLEWLATDSNVFEVFVYFILFYFLFCLLLLFVVNRHVIGIYVRPCFDTPSMGLKTSSWHRGAKHMRRKSDEWGNTALPCSQGKTALPKA